jgi:hypothetical protein
VQELKPDILDSLLQKESKWAKFVKLKTCKYCDCSKITEFVAWWAFIGYGRMVAINQA